MKLRKTLLVSLLLIMFCCFQSQAQESPDNIIEWSDRDKLDWNDYVFRKLKNGNERGEIAISTIRISARGYLNNEMPDFIVKAYFVKSDSWTSDSTHVDLLKHEQLHFDIGELYAQKIRLKIEELKSNGEVSPKKYRSAIKNIITIFKRYSGQYDRETGFGTDDETQGVWNDRIRGLLKSSN
jgi:hypothetical protein